MQPTTELLRPKQRNLPNRILRAIDNAIHLDGIARSSRVLLAEICRFVPQSHPFETVFAHKTTMAERTGLSERSIYRHLVALSDAGLIESLDQERKSRNGRFAVARVRLTHRAAELVGLVEPENEVVHLPPTAKNAPRHTLTEPTISKNQPPSPTENGLPVDLTPLTGQGLSRAGIFKLMGMAKRAGKQLSDIVSAVKSRMSDVKGGRLFAYLAKLATGPTDFAMAASVARQALELERQAKDDARRARAFRERFAGVALTDRAQTTLYLIDSACRFVQMMGKQCGTAPMNDLREWIAGVESGRLVLATDAIEHKMMR